MKPDASQGVPTVSLCAPLIRAALGLLWGGSGLEIEAGE